MERDIRLADGSSSDSELHVSRGQALAMRKEGDRTVSRQLIGLIRGDLTDEEFEVALQELVKDLEEVLSNDTSLIRRFIGLGRAGQA